MSWVIVDDGIAMHPKVLKAGPAASWLWLCGVAYCRKYLTKGAIPRAALPTLGIPTGQARGLVAKLVDARMWVETEGGWQVHDYEAMYPNEDFEKVVKDETRSKRKVAGQIGGLKSGQSRRSKAIDSLEASLLRFDEAHTSPIRTEETDSGGTSPGDPPKKPHPIRDFLAIHEQMFTDRTGQRPAAYGAREGHIVRDLIDRHGFDGAVGLLRRFMASDDPFILRAGFGLNVLQSQVNKLLSDGAKTLQTPAVNRSTPARVPSKYDHINPYGKADRA